MQSGSEQAKRTMAGEFLSDQRVIIRTCRERKRRYPLRLSPPESSGGSTVERFLEPADDLNRRTRTAVCQDAQVSTLHHMARQAKPDIFSNGYDGYGDWNVVSMTPGRHHLLLASRIKAGKMHDLKGI